jgi:type I restriction enzyme M protein
MGSRKVDLSATNRNQFRRACIEADDEPLADLVDGVAARCGSGLHTDFNRFITEVELDADEYGVKITAKRRKLLQSALTEPDAEAEPVIAKVHRAGKANPDPLRGLFAEYIDGQRFVIGYEPDTELRDTETVPLTEPGGIEAFIQREVLPYAPDAWIDESKTDIGYEISFARYFYRPQALRSLEEIRADILAVEKETEGLLHAVVAGS